MLGRVITMGLLAASLSGSLAGAPTGLAAAPSATAQNAQAVKDITKITTADLVEHKGALYQRAVQLYGNPAVTCQTFYPTDDAGKCTSALTALHQQLAAFDASSVAQILAVLVSQKNASGDALYPAFATIMPAVLHMEQAEKNASSSVAQSIRVAETRLVVFSAGVAAAQAGTRTAHIRPPHGWIVHRLPGGGLVAASQLSDLGVKLSAGPELRIVPGATKAISLGSMLKGVDHAAFTGPIHAYPTTVAGNHAIYVQWTTAKLGGGETMRTIYVPLAVGPEFVVTLEAGSSHWSGSNPVLNRILATVTFS